MEAGSVGLEPELETRVLAGTVPSAAESPAIAGSGERLDRYLVIAELGRGEH